MSTQIYVNLPVKNLQRSVEFFTRLGYAFEPKFSSEQGACMIVSGDIYVMLLVEAFFATFTKKPICDATKQTEVLVCLSVDSRKKVDELVAKAVAAGGTTPMAVQDLGFMYGHGYQDLDGHLWEVVAMDPSGATKG